MALKTDILTSFPPVDESMVDALLGKEIEKNHKKILSRVYICPGVFHINHSGIIN